MNPFNKADKEMMAEIDAGLKKNLEEAASEVKNLEGKLEDETKAALDSVDFASDAKSTNSVNEANIRTSIDEKMDKIGQIIKNRMDSRQYVMAMNEIKKVLD